MYLSFLFDHNPGIDRDKAIRLANERAKKMGPDGQILFIPDIMSHGAPQMFRFYEIKPGQPDKPNKEGDQKIASVRAFMQDLDLSYVPGNTWAASRDIVIHRGSVFGIDVVVTFSYRRHETIHGLVVYRFCIETGVNWVSVALLLLILAVVLIAILFPDLFKGPIPVPQPAAGPSGVPGGTIRGTPTPLSRVTGLVLLVLDQTPQTPDGILGEIKTTEPTATLQQVNNSLSELQRLGGAVQVGTGWVRAPGAKAVGLDPRSPQ